MTYCIFTDLRHYDVKSGTQTSPSDDNETLGNIHDIYFDDDTWAIKWFVVETGHWYSSNKILLDSKYFTQVSPATRTFHVSISKADIENAPSVDEHHPVGEQRKSELLYTSFGQDTLFFPGYSGVLMPQTLIERSAVLAEQEMDKQEADVSDADYADRHLRSASEILGYTVSAINGELGPVTDLVINTDQWNITLLALDTSKWLPDRTVVITPESIERISWEESKLFVTMSKQTIEKSPQLCDLKAIKTSYVSTLSDYYLYPMM
ncbi:PRC-barrel domain-containing protein [Granulosicoccus antarcticus]|uniref:PRC-barrel domain-containing protein n=1 Tax=Granulosicoccus antarcticus IMCC3135 TaxID=1192854 RepID=A0A2Z2NIL1_9GAMM|nr:PRC-barrel domain-containing protein [Granulosicoccus antarcticus]ASJ70893.1 hypothetical protein IMCC3135_03900 [Granulosicoccus antarcticus IMCC3135]